MEITGKHVFITGAAKRVARNISENLLENKIKLSAHYHQSKPEADRLVSMAKQKGCEAIALQADLRNLSSISKAVSKAVEKHGPISILINSASAFYPTPFSECTESEWDDLHSTNLKGHFFFSQAAAKQMQEGVILNIVDLRKPVSNFAPYTSAKAGLWMLTKNLALELAPRIRVNSISPGPVLFPEHYSEEKQAQSIERTLLKRPGTPSDIAAAVRLFIENDYLTGVDLAVDGGRSLLGT